MVKQNKMKNYLIFPADNRWRLISTLSIISEKVHNTFMYVKCLKHILLQMIVNNSAAKLTLRTFILYDCKIKIIHYHQNWIIAWNVICGNYEYIKQMHGKPSRYVVCGRVSTAVYKLVMLSVQVRKLVWKLSSFPNSFQTETASVQMCTPLCLCTCT